MLFVLQHGGEFMGTSKGYIAPSTPHWAQAKRQITTYIGNPSLDNCRGVAKKYAHAMSEEGLNNSSVVRNFSKFASFAIEIQKSSYEAALKEIGRDDLLDMDAEDALTELMYFFANDCASIDDKITLDCISEVLVVLDIKQPEDLKKIETNKLIKVLICQFAKFKFAQLFDKQIRSKDPINADKRVLDMQKYVYYAMENSLTDEMLSSINPKNLADEAIINVIIEEAYKLMEELW